MRTCSKTTRARLARAVRVFPDEQTRLAYYDAMNGNSMSLAREKRMLKAMGMAKPPRRFYRPCLPVEMGETIKLYGVDVEAVLREYLKEHGYE